MDNHHINLLNLLLILVAAWMGGLGAKRLGYPAILGELAIGIILGPGVLGLLNDTETIKVLSEVGIILLMVYIGIEIDFRDLKKASWPGFLAAIGGFAVPFVFGYLTIIWFDGSQMAGLFVGIAVGVTSLATKSRILVDLKLLDTRVAYVLMAGALISDTLALLIFSGIIGFADAGSFKMGELAIVGGKALAFFAVTIAIGLFVLPRLGRYFSQSKMQSSTFYFTIILIVAFGYSKLAELAGMHSVLGAFMAGLFIKDNLFPKNVSQKVHKTFYDVSIGFMAPIFFVSAGFAVNVYVFQTDLPLLLTVIFVAIAGKIVGTALFYLPSGHGWREGITVGSGMNGRGAVEIIIAGIGLEMGIINRDIFSILVFMAIFTTLTVPFLLTWTTKWLRSRGELVKIGERTGYLILGVNPISLLLAKQLAKHAPVRLMDANHVAVQKAEEQGFDCIHGNALKDEVMMEAKAETIHTFIGLTRNSEVNILVAQLAHETFKIPNNHVAISREESGAGIDVLETINATSMFAMEIYIDDWHSLIQSGKYEEVEEPVEKKVDTRAWVKKRKSEQQKFLPLYVLSKESEPRPFHYGDVIEAGEKVGYIK